MSGTPSPYDNIAVFGGGAWGTALAVVAARAGRRIAVWARETDVIEEINAKHENARFLPGVALPQAIKATANLADLSAAEAVLIAVPAQRLRTAAHSLAPILHHDAPLILCAKGIETSTGLLMTEVLGEVIPSANIAILSGPSFAIDVARGLPTAVAIAGSRDVAMRLQATLGSSSFRPYASDDLTGVALGGAAKNVYAIACGIAEGLGLGESARAALLARGFAELVRVGEALGGRSETFMGLSGLGDLVLTATSGTSRNFSFGRAIGQGTPIAALTGPGKPLVEGADTTPALVTRAHAIGVELPVAETTAAILSGNLAPSEAILKLMSRRLTSE